MNCSSVFRQRRRKVHKGDGIREISQEVKGQSDQWIYICFNDSDITGIQIPDGEPVSIYEDFPFIFVTETPPEEIRVIRGR